MQLQLLWMSQEVWQCDCGRFGYRTNWYVYIYIYWSFFFEQGSEYPLKPEVSISLIKCCSQHWFLQNPSDPPFALFFALTNRIVHCIKGLGLHKLDWVEILLKQHRHKVGNIGKFELILIYFLKLFFYFIKKQNWVCHYLISNQFNG